MSQLKDLESLGGFIKEELVRKEIKFALDDGTEHEAVIHVRRMSLGAYEKLLTSHDKYGRSASIIAAAVTLGENGEEAIPVEKAYQLHKGLASPMLDAFTEVNGGKAKN